MSGTVFVVSVLLMLAVMVVTVWRQAEREYREVSEAVRMRRAAREDRGTR